MLSLEYGITDNLQIALQRSSLNKMVDGFIKYRFLNQSVDDQKPFSAALFMEATANTTPTADEAIVQPEFKHRWSYVTHLLLARKLGESFSLKLSLPIFPQTRVPRDNAPDKIP